MAEVTITLVDPDWWYHHPAEWGEVMREVAAPFAPRGVVSAAPAPSPRTEPLVYSIEQVARLLGISRSHAYESVQRGQLPHIKLGARILIPRAALDRMLEAPASDS
jgi:excisionase family DNA binding protein